MLLLARVAKKFIMVKVLGAFCKFRLGFINYARVLRPQCSTLDKDSTDPLSAAGRSAPAEGDERDVAYQGDRIFYVYTCSCSLLVYEP